MKVKRRTSEISNWPHLKAFDARVKELGADTCNPYSKVIDELAVPPQLNFSSYDYLGLSKDRRVLEASASAIYTFGTSVSGSRILYGERSIHRKLESVLAQVYEVDSALVFPSGYGTNASVLPLLASRGDLVLYDEYVHQSCRDGIRLSKAEAISFRHNRPKDLRRILEGKRERYRRALLVVEGLDSMNGDISPVEEYVVLKDEFDLLIMVDEAHSFGTVGATGMGVREHCNITGSSVDVWMGSLSKSLASMGGWIAGDGALIDFLRYNASGFVFTAGLAPSLAAAAHRSLELLIDEPERVQNLRANAKLFTELLARNDVSFGRKEAESPIFAIPIGEDTRAFAVAKAFLDEGMLVQPIIYPAVGKKRSILRLFVSSEHRERELESAAELLRHFLPNGDVG